MAWYEQSFGADYLTVYKHRDCTHAKQEVSQMLNWLRLPRGAKVLDLCCGMGRHSVTLAEYGYNVTGVDLSSTLLEEARKNDTPARICWIQGDMRRVPLPCDHFDAVFSLFTSFGYFDEDHENRKVLLEMERLLLPGGKWVLDFLNTEALVACLVPYSERQEGHLIIQEARTVEHGMVKKRIAVLEPDREPRLYDEQVKLYQLPDFEQMLQGTSLVIDQLYGDYSGSPYDPATSARLILVGRKRVL